MAGWGTVAGALGLPCAAAAALAARPLRRRGGKGGGGSEAPLCALRRPCRAAPCVRAKPHMQYKASRKAAWARTAIKSRAHEARP